MIIRERFYSAEMSLNLFRMVVFCIKSAPPKTAHFWTVFLVVHLHMSQGKRLQLLAESTSNPTALSSLDHSFLLPYLLHRAVCEQPLACGTWKYRGS